MRIAAILDHDVSSGGGFNQSLNAIIQMERLCEGQFEFSVYTTVRENISYLQQHGIASKYCKGNVIDKWLVFAATNHMARYLQSRLPLTGKLEKTLLLDGVDIVYFTSPSSQCLSLQSLNYITTVWDLCHRDTPEFPEVRTRNQFLIRDYTFSNTLAQAVCVLCDSPILVERISKSYGVDPARLLSVPFSPSPFFDEKHSAPKEKVLRKYHLEEGYYFYPAQFWAHKNHIRLLQALQSLKNRGIIKHLVLCGGDQGNQGYIESCVHKFGLEGLVHFLGFVPSEDIRGLYEGCQAVVVPTYFGPTNLPPLEAWKIGKPLIYSSHLAEQVGSAALLFDPDSADDLAESMSRVLENNVVADLKKQGALRLAEIDLERAEAENELIKRLSNFAKRLQCWKA